MKKLVFLLIFFTNFCFSQNLVFDKKFTEAIDNWVAFDKNDTDSTYIYGFLYLDEVAGFTFHYGSRFKIEKNSLQNIPNEMEGGFLKSRLSSNTPNVHILSEKEIEELKLPKQPDWLKFYKSDENSVSYLKNMGYHLNAIGDSEKAIHYLLKAYNIEPHYKGLEFELSFAYNATQKFQKAIEILKKAINNDSSNFWFYRELGFAYKNLDKIEDAEQTYRKGISLTSNKNQIAEMAINMAHTYFTKKNKKKFEEWANIVQENTVTESKFNQYIQHWRSNWEEK